MRVSTWAVVSVRTSEHVLTSNASLYMATWVCRPVKLKSSSIKSSDTSAKYSWPINEQKLEIHDSGAADEVDMMSESTQFAQSTVTSTRFAGPKDSAPRQVEGRLRLRSRPDEISKPQGSVA